jgi:alkanesulfonate monooxygenase SsuD/methylene tetrahydromethanopterin reductase-like flavin-dependent oxidoreductase (luciferase family)
VGVGTGGRSRKFSGFGVDPGSLVARFNEGLQVMKALWSEPRVTFKGRFWPLDDAAMEPKPSQKPWPPIWFGGNHPAALRRAVQHGDGFFGAGPQTTAQFADQVKVVREALVRSGRSAAEFRIAKRVYIAVDDDEARGRRRIAAALDQFYGYFGLRGMETVAVYGRRRRARKGSARSPTPAPS